jgi:hypothetical protein
VNHNNNASNVRVGDTNDNMQVEVLDTMNQPPFVNFTLQAQLTNDNASTETSTLPQTTPIPSASSTVILSTAAATTEATVGTETATTTTATMTIATATITTATTTTETTVGATETTATAATTTATATITTATATTTTATTATTASTGTAQRKAYVRRETRQHRELINDYDPVQYTDCSKCGEKRRVGKGCDKKECGMKILLSTKYEID